MIKDSNIERTWLPISMVDHGAFSFVSTFSDGSKLEQVVTIWARRIEVFFLACAIGVFAIPNIGTAEKVAIAIFFTVGAVGTFLAFLMLADHIVTCWIDVTTNSICILSGSMETKLFLTDLVGFQVISRSKGTIEYQMNLVVKVDDLFERYSLYACSDKRRIVKFASWYTQFTESELLGSRILDGG